MLEKVELSVYKKEAATFAKPVSVRTNSEYEAAAETLKLVKASMKKLEDRRKEITAPLMASLASARALFAPFEDSLKKSEKSIKAAMKVFSDAEDMRIEAEKARIAARVEKGTMRPDTALDKLNAVGATPTANGTSVRYLSRVRIVDESKIPRMYLVPDMAAITKAVVQDGLVVEGVEGYKEKIISSRS